ncbi:MAG: metalloregulator ArsR/SmtB family transcription factor [Emcibacteraceae bacterium]
MDRFAALAEPNRRRMIEIIAANEKISATEISSRFAISAPAVSQHLKILREAGIVNMEKKAQQRLYSINSQGVDEMWEWLNHIRQFWGEKLSALEEYLIQEKEKI